MAHYHPENSRGWIVASIFDGTLSSRRVSRTLKKMVADPEAKGHSDIGVQNLMYMLSVSLRPRRVLEIGTHIGMAAVIIGHALKANRYGKLITLEPAPHYFSISARYVKAARLSDFVQIWPEFSYDPNCKTRLREEMPFELIFIDGAHDYQAAAHDIAFCAELLCDNGVMVLHDVGAISHSLDPTGRGGVRQALWDFCEDNPEFRAIFLEFPVWLNNTGTAIVVKEQLEPPVFGKLAKVMAAE
jgi:predicted O-methyltransferase YrrM